MPPPDVVEIPSVLIQLRIHFLQLQRPIDIHMYTYGKCEHWCWPVRMTMPMEM